MAKKSAAVIEEPDEDLELEEEDEDLELEEDDEEDEAPAPKKKAAKTRKAPATTKGTDGYGISWLADHISDTTGKSTSPAGVRVLLRKMAKDDTSPLSREVGEDRSRYTFTGENDKVVKAVIKAVKGGALDKKPRTGNADNLAAARAAKAAKAASTDAPTKTKKSKVEEAAPAKATRRRKG